jgi:DNA-binding FadR family transcriptional regulator
MMDSIESIRLSDKLRGAMARLVNASLSERLADELANGITSGRWPVGRRLPPEHAIAAEFDVGRSTVREAIRVLVSRGLVASRQGSGTTVIAIREAGSLERALRSASFADVYRVRIALEAEAARLAADRSSRIVWEPLAAALRQRATASDAAGLAEADLAFHREVVVASGNPVLLDLFVHFEPRLHEVLRSIAAGVSGSGPVSRHDDEHASLLDALQQGDADAAVRLTRGMHEQTLRAITSSRG